MPDLRLVAPPRRETLDHAGRLERHYRAQFDRVAPFTIGAEEELLLVDPETHAPVALDEEVLDLFDRDRRIAPELRSCMLEAITPVCVSVGDVARELASVRALIAERLRGTAFVVAAGTHPTVSHPGPITARPRYEGIIDENPWAESRLLTCGLHVHVAVGGAERTLAVYNALRSYLPEIVAVAANAPIHHGVDSGLATVRPKLNQALPRSGVPPAFGSWRELAEFVVWSGTGGLVLDHTYHWWDLRLHPGHGTVEVRAADTQTHTEDTAAVVAFVQSLTCDLALRWNAGEALPVHAHERITENMWIATRDGIAGSLVDLDSGERRPAVERIRELTDRLLPTAASLGCDAELLHLERLAFEGGGAGRQRRTVTRCGIDGLVPALAAHTTAPPDELDGKRIPCIVYARSSTGSIAGAPTLEASSALIQSPP